MSTPAQRCPVCQARAGRCVRTTATARGLRRIWHCGACEAQFLSYDEPAGEKAAVERRTVWRMCDDMARQLERIRAVFG